MTKGSITLSHAELDRVSVIRSIISRQLTPAQAAPRLQLSVRQVQRLTRTYRTCGATRMASTHRGQCPRNALLPPPAVILGTPVVPAEGGATPSRRHSRHPSRPRRRRDYPSRRHSRHPSRPRRRRDYPLPPSFSAPQSSPPKAGRLGCRESRETKATTLALPLNINRG